jgi:hypothetical protein
VTLSHFKQEEDSLTAVNLNILPRIWIPDVEILDLMSFETHKVLSKLEGEPFLPSTEI